MTGWASFWEGELWAAGRFKKEAPEPPDVQMLPAIVVVEKPVHYPNRRNDVDPNTLITLGIFAGELAGMMRMRAPGIDVAYVRPSTWKGTLPKHVTNERTLAQLTPAELEKLPRRPRAKNYDHNMLDAVGIGIWQLQRERQR